MLASLLRLKNIGLGPELVPDDSDDLGTRCTTARLNRQDGPQILLRVWRARLMSEGDGSARRNEHHGAAPDRWLRTPVQPRFIWLHAISLRSIVQCRRRERPRQNEHERRYERAEGGSGSVQSMCTDAAVREASPWREVTVERSALRVVRRRAAYRQQRREMVDSEKVKSGQGQSDRRGVASACVAFMS